MEDLNDYQYFMHTVANGGFAAAGRTLGIPKSKLSRRVSALEQRLGVRLIERSSRSFQVTDIGQAFFERCKAMMLEAERASAVVAEAISEPRGPVRMSVPLGFINGPVGSMLPEFLERYPHVRLQILATDRKIDVVNERMHLALRVRTKPDTDADLTMRLLSRDRRILVASPSIAAFFNGQSDISALRAVSTVSLSDPPSELGEQTTWELVSNKGQSFAFQHQPRLTCRSGPALRHALVAGLGIGLMLRLECAEDIAAGRLFQIFPDWATPDGNIYLVFPAASGMPPAVRALVDFLVEKFKPGADR